MDRIIGQDTVDAYASFIPCVYMNQQEIFNILHQEQTNLLVSSSKKWT